MNKKCKNNSRQFKDLVGRLSLYCLHVYAVGLPNPCGIGIGGVETGYGFSIGSSNRLYPVKRTIRFKNRFTCETEHQLNSQRIITADYTRFDDLINDYPEFAGSKKRLLRAMAGHDLKIKSEDLDRNIVSLTAKNDLMKNIGLDQLSKLILLFR